jgi:hypothetical protein
LPPPQATGAAAKVNDTSPSPNIVGSERAVSVLIQNFLCFSPVQVPRLIVEQILGLYLSTLRLPLSLERTHLQIASLRLQATGWETREVSICMA